MKNIIHKHTFGCGNMIEPEKGEETWRGEQIAFYSSPAWKNLRKAFLKERGGLCEMCLKNGIYKAATLAHHIIPVTAKNVNDPQISLNADNLMALCTECHAAIHSSRRWRFDENGKMIVVPDPPVKKS